MGSLFQCQVVPFIFEEGWWNSFFFIICWSWNWRSLTFSAMDVMFLEFASLCSSFHFLLISGPTSTNKPRNKPSVSLCALWVIFSQSVHAAPGGHTSRCSALFYLTEKRLSDGRRCLSFTSKRRLFELVQWQLLLACPFSNETWLRVCVVHPHLAANSPLAYKNAQFCIKQPWFPVFFSSFF